MKKNYTQLVISPLVISILVISCASEPSRSGSDAQPTTNPEQTLDSIRNSMETEGKGTAANGNVPPQAVADALMPGYAPSLPGKMSPREERFDINVNRIGARVFFMSLVQDTPINIVVHPDVDGVISLNLKSVTIDEVLEVTRDVYGYEYQKNRAGYYILPARLQSQIYNVSYLNVARKGKSQTRVSSGQFSGSESGSGDDGGSSNNNRSNNARGGSGRSYSGAASSEVSTESEADFWKDLETTIYTLIGNKDGRSVVVNGQSGIVVVRAMPGELRDVENFLNSAQLNLHRQVLIEAKVLEVQLNDTHQAGVNWAALHVNDTGSRSQIGSQFEILDGSSEIVDSSGNLLSSGLTSTRALPGFGNIFAIGAASDDFALIIRLLDQQGSVNVLSSPRVSTVNNQKAVIKVGSDEFFVTEISSTTTTGTATTTTPQIILTPFFSGIALDVTPQINDKQEVILHIHPAISEVTDQVKDITVGGQDQSLPLAFSTVRESDSIVRAQNGQVIIIGGLMQNQQTKVEAGIPVVSKIPLLGRLFKQTQNVVKRSELVILLKPIVIGQESGTWDTEISRITERMETLKP